jgi:ammonia channel protein AmtB
MVWSDNGFLANLGVMDFAGGTPVHICSSATAAAISVYLSYPLFRSKKSAVRTPSHLKIHGPGNSMSQLIALIIIWNSWLAFDAGTTLSFNFKSVMALCVTNLCASGGAMTWASITYFETGKWSLDSTFMGAIAGLVMITPAAGFIDMPTSFFFGVVGAIVGRQALRIKFTKLAARLRWVDNGDSFATHFALGLLGTISTGLFARKEVAAYDGFSEVAGGVFFDGNIRQLGVQVLEALIGMTWSFAGSYIIIALIDCIPGLEVLAKDEQVASPDFANKALTKLGILLLAWTRPRWKNRLKGCRRMATTHSKMEDLLDWRTDQHVWWLEKRSLFFCCFRAFCFSGRRKNDDTVDEKSFQNKVGRYHVESHACLLSERVQ